MNTSSHVVISLALLSSQQDPVSNLAIVCGALGPDLPIGALYAWRRLVYGERGEEVWNGAYPRLEWLFDFSHSIPLQVAVLGLSVSFGLHPLKLFAISSLLHQLIDFPLHGRDAHAHFVPFSQVRFRSPLSYWEKERHGIAGGDIELALTALASFGVWRLFPDSLPYRTLAITCLLATLGVNPHLRKKLNEPTAQS